MTTEEIVGECRFEYMNVRNDHLTIRVNVLIKEQSFEEVKERQSEIIKVIVGRLEKDKKFQKIGISTNYLKCYITYVKNPISLVVVFTLKDLNL